MDTLTTPRTVPSPSSIGGGLVVGLATPPRIKATQQKLQRQQQLHPNNCLDGKTPLQWGP
ncbi:hypothetical protein DPMN_024806 [Dreissena polymorpha]|uniref:Uncharacterized protein n=1 Tax=Dreissena polymorpha TaxID=45954 RepID=A0A9D4RB89_DREPO|nr:hypothetical protein DPMN_024806 [Dreissena polymorpha]